MLAVLEAVEVESHQPNVERDDSGDEPLKGRRVHEVVGVLAPVGGRAGGLLLLLRRRGQHLHTRHTRIAKHNVNVK